MGCEVSWFSALCDDDYEFLGVPDPGLLSSWEHCRDIALPADSGVRQPPAAVRLRDGYRLPCLRRRHRAACCGGCSCWSPSGGRDVAAAAGPPARDHRPDAGRPPDHQHHLLRPAGRGPCSAPAIAHAGVMQSPARPARTASRWTSTASSSTQAGPAAHPAGRRLPAVLLRRPVRSGREVAAKAADVYLMWPDTMARRGRAQPTCGPGPPVTAATELRLPRPRRRARDRGGGTGRRPAPGSRLDDATGEAIRTALPGRHVDR